MGVTVPTGPVSSVTVRLEGNCECVLEMVTPGTSGQCLGLSPGKTMSQQRSSVPSDYCKGPGLALSYLLNLSLSFLAHAMGLLRVPNS